ncbi:uncharacterized protein LOC110861910 [Folsomia candida]|uniref:uncharacterized protein LOC110861910 n=1 Tax=Folsomia candida TaxID=158441 RepID=UPI000B8FF38D|nr:uncharacterized protein LOC110861910 [Folsomia candida]
MLTYYVLFFKCETAKFTRVGDSLTKYYKSSRLEEDRLNDLETREDMEKYIFSENNNSNLSQTDPIVLKYLKKYHLHNGIVPGRKIHYPTVVNELDLYVDLALRKVLKDKKTGGFFVECGANDGEFMSNTIALEKDQQWSGLLIEGSPLLSKILRRKRRNAWVADVCLTGRYPERIEFLKHKNTAEDWRIGNGIGKINPGNKYEKPLLNLPDTGHYLDHGFLPEDYISEGMISCFPLYSILSAINVSTVDFFSLDVEGHEYKVLQGIPFDLLDIKVIIVEHATTPEGKNAIKDLMVKNGYKLYMNGSNDYIFIKKNYLVE